MNYKTNCIFRVRHLVNKHHAHLYHSDLTLIQNRERVEQWTTKLRSRLKIAPLIVTRAQSWPRVKITYLFIDFICGGIVDCISCKFDFRWNCEIDWKSWWTSEKWQQQSILWIASCFVIRPTFIYGVSVCLNTVWSASCRQDDVCDVVQGLSPAGRHSSSEQIWLCWKPELQRFIIVSCNSYWLRWTDTVWSEYICIRPFRR